MKITAVWFRTVFVATSHPDRRNVAEGGQSSFILGS
jgi:hypothetical protein